MAVSSEATVIIDVELQSENARSKAAALGTEIQKLKDANAALAKENKKTSVTYVENQQRITQLNREQRAYINLSNQATGSNRQLRAQLSLLNAQYDSLGREQRDNTTAGRALQLQIAAINKELLKSEGATGRFQRNVGNYANGVSSTISAAGGTSGGFGFLPQAVSSASAIVSEFRQQIGFTTAAINAQREANELLIISTEAQAEADAKAIALEEAKAEAIAAETKAQRLATEAEQLRAEAEGQRALITAQLVTEEEREIAILTQMAIEQEAIIAEERVRIQQETALAAVNAELVATEEARAAAEASLAASTASVAAAEEAVAAKATAMKAALLGTGIGAIIVLVGSLVGYLHDLDTAADGTSQVFAGLKAQVSELGRSFLTLDFKNLSQRIQSIGIQAAVITDQQQTLEDSLLNQSVKSQQAQAKVAQLRVEAMNRTLSPEVRQRYIQQAEEIDKVDLEAKKKLADRELNQAEISINLTGNLTKYQQQQLKQRGVEYALYLQNNLTGQGKVTDEQTKQLAKAYAAQTQIQQEYTQRYEKRQNLADRIAEQAEQKREAQAAKEKAAAEKLQGELDKINEDRIKSLQVTNERLFTEREKEIGAINADIDKRVRMYQKYNQDTTQLEFERQTRISQLNAKFHQQDLVTIRQNLDEAQQLRISLIGDSDQRAFEQAQFQNQKSIDQVDRNIATLAGRIALGEQGLTQLIQSEVEKRNALTDQGNQQRAERESALRDHLQQITEDANAAAYQSQLDEYQREYDLVQQRLELNQQLTQSYGDLTGAISDLTGKNTVLGKVAFLAQKAFAIQQIILNAELTKSQIILRYEILKTQATLASSLAGPFAPFVAGAAIAGLTAAQTAEIAAATASEVTQVAIVAATAISGVIGKEKGGIQYNSDGRGAILPGYSKKDNMNARLRDGEAVIVSEAARDPYTRQVLSDINVAYGGKAFATGGLYGGSYIQQSSQKIASQVFQSNQINDYLSRIKIYTAITDIKTADAKYTQITQAGDF